MTSALTETPGLINPKPELRQGFRGWPEFSFVREHWPTGLRLPSPERVMAVAYEIAGLNYANYDHRNSVKIGVRSPIRAQVHTAAFPILVGLLNHSSLEATRILGKRRHYTRNDHLVQACFTPAGKAVVLFALRRLLNECKQTQENDSHD